MNKHEMYLKLKKTYPNAQFKIGDEVRLHDKEMIKLYGSNKYKIIDFKYVYDIVGDIIIILDRNFDNVSDNYIHPSHLINLSYLRKQKIKNIID